jgi:tetratricopeptide (TPR) repeat protein
MAAGAKHYRAFISYSHRDKAEATWLHGALENYRIPSKLVGRETSERFGLGPVPARLHPIFRDRDELPASGDLGFELRSALENALCLIVICSPASAKSQWVNEEILSFKRMHGEMRVFALIVRGEPGHPQDECFPNALKFVMGADGVLTDTPGEPIAADMRPEADGKRLAKYKLIAGLTGVKLDELVQREAARRTQRLVVIASASIFGMVFALGLAFYANTQRIAAIQQRKIAENESAAARAAADYLVGTFELANPATENPRTITALTILGRSADRARTELANQPQIQIRLIDTVARAYNNLGLFDEARRTLDQSRNVILKAGAAGADVLNTLAATKFRQGDLDGAITTAGEAESALGTIDLTGSGSAPPSAGTVDPRGVEARSTEIIAQSKQSLGDQKAALAAYDKALVLYRASSGVKPAEIARTLNNRGLLLSDMGRYDAADASLVESNRIYRLVYSDKHLAVGRSYFAIAQNDYAQGSLAKAQTNIAAALGIYDKVLDPVNPIRADALVLQGQVLTDLKRPAEAIKSLTEARDIQRKIFGKPQFNIGVTEVYLGLAQSANGDTAGALATLDDAKHNYDIGYGKLHPNHGDLLINRATILAHVGRRIEARADCAKGLEILEQTMGKDNNFYATSVATCAKIS